MSPVSNAVSTLRLTDSISGDLAGVLTRGAYSTRVGLVCRSGGATRHRLRNHGQGSFRTGPARKDLVARGGGLGLGRSVDPSPVRDCRRPWSASRDWAPSRRRTPCPTRPGSRGSSLETGRVGRRVVGARRLVRNRAQRGLRKRMRKPTTAAATTSLGPQGPFRRDLHRGSPGETAGLNSRSSAQRLTALRSGITRTLVG